MACSTRITKTYDNEDQKNGTYYHYQAATSGMGSTVNAENAIIPDTFCPLGWQLPYGGTGGDYYNQSKSWRYLFTTYGYENDKAGRNGSQSYPLSYIKSGQTIWGQGALYRFGKSGRYWAATVNINNSAFLIDVSYMLVDINAVGKAEGYPIRRVNNF